MSTETPQADSARLARRANPASQMVARRRHRILPGEVVLLGCASGRWVRFGLIAILRISLSSSLPPAGHSDPKIERKMRSPLNRAVTLPNPNATRSRILRPCQEFRTVRLKPTTKRAAQKRLPRSAV